MPRMPVGRKLRRSVPLSGELSASDTQTGLRGAANSYLRIRPYVCPIPKEKYSVLCALDQTVVCRVHEQPSYLVDDRASNK